MLPRLLPGVVATLAVAYIALCGWMALRQRDFIYFPQFTRIAASETDFALTRGDVTLRGWRVNPGRRDAIVYFGGNAESIGAMREPFARWFPDHTAYLLAYRGYGASDGTPTEAALAADAVALFDQVRVRHPGGRIVVIGRSLGSGVAAHLVSQRPVDGLVLITPYDSLAAVAQTHYRWLPVRWLLRDRFDAARALAGYRAPVLVIHAGRDTVIPPVHTRRLVAALPVPPKVVELRDADHNTVDAEPEFVRALVSFMK